MTPVRLKRELIEDNVQNYLMKFGYISQSSDGAGALRTEDSVRQAIRELQEFGGLPVTGQIDERTKELMSKPRCGLPDVTPSSFRKKRFTVQGQKWMYTNLTWSLRSKSLKHLDSYEVRYVFTKALEVWSRHSKLTFTEVDSDRADILVYFHRGDHGDNFPFDGKGQVLAHAFFPGGGRGGDAHFDEDETWLTREDAQNDDGTSLFHVAAHEFGHSLGLSHSPVEGALMYPWYQGMQNGFDYELPEDDRLGIQHLYGANEDRLWDRIRPYNPTTTTTTTTTTQRPHVTRPERRPHHDPERRPHDPRYHPNGRYPYNPHKPYNPEKPHYPRKPMHPDSKPHYPKYPAKPSYPDRRYPPERYPDKHPDRQHPDKYPERNYPRPTDKYPDRMPPQRYPELPRQPPKESPKLPDTCDTTYDAVAVIRRQVFIFKDAYFWRIGDNGLLPGYPAEIKRFWRGFPDNFTHVDAVYERPDSKIVFFIGKQFYVFSGNSMENGYPRPLADLGLPIGLKKIDGAMVWGYNGKTFLFSENMYWRFDEELMRVELDYPRDMSMWKGVGTDIDAVFQWKDGRTYFFKGKGFWKFNDLLMRVEDEHQIPSGPFWMGCQRNLQDYEPGNKAPYTDITSKSASANPNINSMILSVLILLFYTIT